MWRNPEIPLGASMELEPTGFYTHILERARYYGQENVIPSRNFLKLTGVQKSQAFPDCVTRHLLLKEALTSRD